MTDDMMGRGMPRGAVQAALPEGWPDVRGWRVASAEGRELGVVTGLVADAEGREVRYVVLAPEDQRAAEVRIPIDAMRINLRASSLVVDDAVASLYGATAAEAAPPVARRAEAAPAVAPVTDAGRGAEAGRMTVSEEELQVTTRRVSAGDVGVRKHVEVEHVSRPVTTQRQEVTVERRAAAAGIDGATAKPTMRDGEIIVPIVEEELVIEKRLVVKEEIVIRTVTVTEQHTIEADLRKERVDVSRDDVRPRGAGLGDDEPERSVR